VGRIAGYACLGMVFLALLMWAVSYRYEQRVCVITGNLESFSAQGFGYSSRAGSSYQDASSAPGKAQDEVVNESLALLKAYYGQSVNVSRSMPAIVEDPNGNRAGVGFVIDTPEGQRLIVVLPDGWIGDYALTTRK
jgi:hypothetical protein